MEMEKQSKDQQITIYFKSFSYTAMLFIIEWFKISFAEYHKL